MNILKIYAARQQDPQHAKNPTIAFLGDSVTHGCFELRIMENDRLDTVFDHAAVYHQQLKNILAEMYPAVQANYINAGVSGNNAVQGYERLERDVLSHKPDLTVVCFGLNDSHKGQEGLERYVSHLTKIFDELHAAGSEVIFMTPNMMNTKVSTELHEEVLIRCAKRAMQVQTEGTMDQYMEAAKKTAIDRGVTVCDVYAKWKQMAEHGADTTELLSNYINHPIRPMHRLFATSLLDTMLREN